ncbi:MAG: SIMPL domain-containing protein [Dehalococcoidales bacterium]|nr:SIMPL domain-containing protein [Dehalococcoidales bacterium]
MKKMWLAVIGVVMVIGVVALAGCSGGVDGTLELKGQLNSQQEGIWVNGEGKVTAVPDVAIISVGIEAQETTVAAANDEARVAMDDVMNALKDAGIKDEDIQTQYFNINRVTRWDDEKRQEEVIGYRVTNVVTAKIRKVEDAGAVIDAVADAGGDLTRINNISFTVDDPAPYQAEARKLAVADAAAKAKTLAEVADVTLGKATYISESSYMPGPIYRDMVGVAEAAAAPGVETPISPGEIEITTNVQIAYAIAD